MGARGPVIATIALGLCLVAAPTLRADRFALTSGGIVEGTLLNPAETKRQVYLIRTAQGVTLSIPIDQVASILRQSPAEAEYAALAPTVGDTVAGQWKLAEWCRTNKLTAQREAHLRRIIELDPNHGAARRALGYVELQGEWTLPAEARAKKGLILFRGEWRTAQDIALIQERERVVRLNKEWLGRLRRWRLDLDEPKQAALAWKRFAELRDPAAAPSLGELLAQEKTRSVKGLYIESLFEMKDETATAVLMQHVLNEPDLEVFHLCADRVEQLKPQNGQQFYLDVLNRPDNPNVRINRAALLLGRLGDHSVAGVLIDNLVTSHKIVVGGGAGRGDAYSSTFDNTGGSNFSAGSTPKVLVQTRENKEVLDALVRVTGGTSFGFDVPAWRRWLAVERARGGDVKLTP